MKKPQTLEIENLLALDVKPAEIARRFGVSRAWVGGIKKRMRKPTREQKRMLYFVLIYSCAHILRLGSACLWLSCFYIPIFTTEVSISADCFRALDTAVASASVFQCKSIALSKLKLIKPSRSTKNRVNQSPGLMSLPSMPETYRTNHPFGGGAPCIQTRNIGLFENFSSTFFIC